MSEPFLNSALSIKRYQESGAEYPAMRVLMPLPRASGLEGAQPCPDDRQSAVWGGLVPILQNGSNYNAPVDRAPSWTG